MVDDNLNLFSLFSEKTSVDISCELSAKTIHMKCQDMFSVAKKIKKKKKKKIVKIVVCCSCDWRFILDELPK